MVWCQGGTSVTVTRNTYTTGKLKTLGCVNRASKVKSKRARERKKSTSIYSNTYTVNFKYKSHYKCMKDCEMKTLLSNFRICMTIDMMCEKVSEPYPLVCFSSIIICFELCDSIYINLYNFNVFDYLVFFSFLSLIEYWVALKWNQIPFLFSDCVKFC